MRELIRSGVLASLLLGMVAGLSAQGETIWRVQQRITGLGSQEGDSFGRSIAVDGNTMIVGARGDNVNGSNSGTVFVFNNNGTNWVQEQEIFPDDGEPGDSFGWLVEVDGDTALIGAPGVDGDGTDRGAAYVYTLNQDDVWVLQQKLVPDVPTDNARFGVSIALDGNLAIVGADGEPEDEQAQKRRGRVYVFERSGTTWTQDQELNANDGNPNDGYQFGWSLALNGDRLLVGSPSFVDTGTLGEPETGKVYVFENEPGAGWSQDHELTADDGADGDEFGISVSLGSDVAVVGAFGDDASRGSAYVFEYSATPSPAWTQAQKLLASDGLPGHDFGLPVRIGSDKIVVGASRYTVQVGDTQEIRGISYLFEPDEVTGDWTETQQLTASDTNDNDLFGISTVIGAAVIYVGAENAGNSSTGQVYSFTDQPIPIGSDTVGVFFTFSGQWVLRNSNSSGNPSITPFGYGRGGTRLTGDWDGDGNDTVGIFYSFFNGEWLLRNSNSSGNPDIEPFNYGFGGLPVVGDWNGNGTDSIGIFFESSGSWYLRDSASSGNPDVPVFTYGKGGIPLVGDWDGDGIDTIGVFYRSTGQWLLRNTNSGGQPDLAFTYGSGGTPVVGDWNADGTDTIGVFYASNGAWYLRDTNSSGGATYLFNYGKGGIPVTGDWDGPGAGVLSIEGIGAISLLDFNTGERLMVLQDGDTIQLADLPEEVMIVAEAFGGDAVVFDYQTVEAFNIDSEAPFTLTGESPTVLTSGEHFLTATLQDEAGNLLDTLSLNFVVE